MKQSVERYSTLQLNWPQVGIVSASCSWGEFCNICRLFLQPVVSEHQQDLDRLPASCFLKTHLAAAAFSLYFTCTRNNLDLENLHARLQSPSRQISRQFNYKTGINVLILLHWLRAHRTLSRVPLQMFSFQLTCTSLKKRYFVKATFIVLMLEDGQNGGFVVTCIGGCD